MATFIPTDMNHFPLPCIVSNDKDYYIELQAYLDRYIIHVQKIPDLNKECLEKTKRNVKLIIQSLLLFNNARIGDAKECIKEILQDYYEKPYIVSTIDKSYAFRGMAPNDIQPKQFDYNKKYADRYKKMNEFPLSFLKARVSVDLIERKDMLHIPFDKRGLITTQRFSIQGVPCFYAATTSFGCWLEMEMPELNVFQVASYKLPSDLKVLNMCISQHTINGSTGGGWVEDYDLQNVYSLIEIFPLVCATSFEVLEMNRSFKSEYIISQLIMQVVNELDIDGIAYLSKKMQDKYAYPQTVNIAILMQCDKFPPYDKNSLDMYWRNANKIKLSNVAKYSEFLNTYPQNSADHKPPYLSYINEIYYNTNHDDVLLGGKQIKYTKTKFSEFDEFLVKQKHYEFK